MPISPKLQAHPLADLFPAMSTAELETLAADIKQNGLREPIVLLDGKILDGRSRYAACHIADIGTLTDDFIDFAESIGGDPLAFVLSKNLHRRHLTESQRSMVADNLATMKHGRPKKDAPVHQKVSRKSAAAALNVSPRSVANATAVRKHGTPELVKAVETGHVPVKTAAVVAREPAEQQRQFVEDTINSAFSPKTKARAKPKPNGKAEEASAVPADQFQQTVDGFISVSVHLVRREQVSILKDKNLPPKHRDPLLECAKFVVDQMNDLIATWKPTKR